MASAGPPEHRRPSLIDINLASVERRRKEGRPPVSLFSVIVVFLILALAYAIFPLSDIPNLYGLWHEQREDVDSLGDTYAEKEALLADLMVPDPEAQALVDQIDALEALLDAMSEDYLALSQSAVAWSEVLEEISDAAPSEITILSVSEGSNVEIEGTASSGYAIDSYRIALDNTGLFSEVLILEKTYSAEGDSTVTELVEDCEDKWTSADDSVICKRDTTDDNHMAGEASAKQEIAKAFGGTEPIDECDAAWTAEPNVTCSADNSDYKDDPASAKQVIGGAFTTGLIAYDNIASLNLMGYKAITFWIKSSLAQEEGGLQLRLYDKPDHQTMLELFPIPALAANTWKQVTLTRDDPSAYGTVESVGLYAKDDPGACTIWLDDIKATNAIDFPFGLIAYEEIPAMDLSHYEALTFWIKTGEIGEEAHATVIENCEDAWTSADTDNVDCDTDNTAGNYKVDAASAKQVIDLGFETGLIAYEDISEDLTNYHAISLWIKSSVAQGAGDLQLLLADDNNCSSLLETLNIPALTANTWAQVSMALDDPSALDAVESVGIYATGDPGACTIWLDDVRATAAERGAGELWLLLDDDDDCSSPLVALSIPEITAGTWEEVAISLDDPSVLTSVRSLGLAAKWGYYVSGECDIWLDDIRTTTGGGIYSFKITAALPGGSE